MQTLTLPDAAEERDNATFEAVLMALAMPGTIRSLPEPGLAPVLLALVDRECRAFADDENHAALLVQTGATPVPAELADHLAMRLDSEESLARLARVTAGSLLYPDQGATVIAPARIGTGQRLRLTGPGIETATEIALDGLHPGLWAARARLCRYPLGIEMIFVDGDRLLALPRSTSVEEL